MAQGFVKMASNYAVNAFKSTLGYLKGGAGDIRGAFSGAKSAYSQGGMSGLKGFGSGYHKGVMRRAGAGKGSAMSHYGRMGVTAGAAGAGGMAAADFMNPWGLGWGD